MTKEKIVCRRGTGNQYENDGAWKLPNGMGISSGIFDVMYEMGLLDPDRDVDWDTLWNER